MSDDSQASLVRRKGIYLLPNLLTTATVFFGYFAIVVAASGQYTHAAIAIYVAVVTDGLDGRIARLTNTQTGFGRQFDSLADMLAFGAAPAIVMLNWALSMFGTFGWTVSFVYVAATALRLARFNVQDDEAQCVAFQGLPCTLAAAVMAGFIWASHDLGMGPVWVKWFGLVTTLFLSTMMVSDIPYPSFKKIDWSGRVSFLVAFATVLVFFLISLNPPMVLLSGVYVYALSGPTMWLYGMVRQDGGSDVWQRLLRLGHEHEDTES